MSSKNAVWPVTRAADPLSPTASGSTSARRRCTSSEVATSWGDDVGVARTTAVSPEALRGRPVERKGPIPCLHCPGSGWPRSSRHRPHAVGDEAAAGSYRHIPGFLRWTLRIRGQLASARGLAGYSLDAKLLGKTFWTVSAWASQEDMEAFVGQDPHAAATAAIRPHMEAARFVSWSGTADDLPVRWADVRHRMDLWSRGGTATGPPGSVE